MKAGYLQFRPEFGNPQKNIAKIKSLLHKETFDLMVIPELANSGYLFSNKKELKDLAEDYKSGNFTSELLNICIDKNCFIVAGLCEKDGDKFYNSSVLICPDERVFVYRKLHLFKEEKKWFTPGNLFPEVYEIESKSFGKVKIGMMICFDWVFPEMARTLALKGAQIICHPSNLVMTYCQSGMFARALENGVFTITANRTGKDKKINQELSFTGESVILDPKGRYLRRATKSKTEVAIADINPKDALSKKITSGNDLFADRRTKFYSLG